MRIKELIEKGLIKETAVRNEEIVGSMNIAEKFLKEAKGNLGIKLWDVAFILAYNSMFHIARALLFKIGYKERSHFAMIVVLREKYNKDHKIQRFLDILDSYRISRHAIQYRGDSCSETDAKGAIKDSEEFLRYINTLV